MLCVTEGCAHSLHRILQLCGMQEGSDMLLHVPSVCYHIFVHLALTCMEHFFLCCRRAHYGWKVRKKRLRIRLTQDPEPQVQHCVSHYTWTAGVTMYGRKAVPITSDVTDRCHL